VPGDIMGMQEQGYIKGFKLIVERLEDRVIQIPPSKICLHHHAPVS
jgi:hypothetical protein